MIPHSSAFRAPQTASFLLSSSQAGSPPDNPFSLGAWPGSGGIIPDTFSSCPDGEVLVLFVAPCPPGLITPV